MRIEIRSDSVLLDGYVNAVGRFSRVLPSPKGPFIEQIVPKTFERALMKGGNVDILFNHLKDRKLGSTTEGNLQLREDNIGLRATATITDPEVMEKARNGELKGWSFGFISNRDSWQEGTDGVQKRSVEDLDLAEVSVLDRQPAYVATSIEARGETESILTENRIEEFVANIEDRSKSNEEHKKSDNNDDKTFDYSHFEKQKTLLQLKGRLHK
jgi:HK97 family phage prohead protease